MPTRQEMEAQDWELIASQPGIELYRRGFEHATVKDGGPAIDYPVSWGDPAVAQFRFEQLEVQVAQLARLSSGALNPTQTTEARQRLATLATGLEARIQTLKGGR